MARGQSLDEIALFNGIVTPVSGAQEKISVTDTSQQSAQFITPVVQIYAATDCWIVFGSNPTSVANDGNSTFHPSGFIKVYRSEIGTKLAVIRDSANGDIHIAGGA